MQARSYGRDERLEWDEQPSRCPDCDVGEKEAFRAFVKPRVAELLEAIGLDVTYHRALGDYLYYHEGDREIAILDMAGGFGASLFGHNNPKLLVAASQVLADRRPFNAQASVRGPAGQNLGGGD